MYQSATGMLASEVDVENEKQNMFEAVGNLNQSYVYDDDSSSQ